nr:hypothetical protein CFP56_54245 [Quercus suber]
MGKREGRESLQTLDDEWLGGLRGSSVGDMRWLLSIFDIENGGAGADGINLSLPPIASNDPILSWVWSFVATLQMSQLGSEMEVCESGCGL